MSKIKNTPDARVVTFLIFLFATCAIVVAVLLGAQLLIGGEELETPETSELLNIPGKLPPTSPDGTLPQTPVVTGTQEGDNIMDSNTTASDTRHSETEAPGTLPPETLPPETILPETIPPETEPPTPPEPTYDLDAWHLTLVNPWNKLSLEYIATIELSKVNGKQVDVRMVDPLKQMLNDCYEANKTVSDGCTGKPLVCSGFRTQEFQEGLFNKKINKIKAANPGISDEEAYTLAAKEVAIPGTSEHQLGLAVDIVCCNTHYNLDAQKTKIRQQWLIDNCHKYGFILRFPADKTDVTGIIYEPWHYRYVGVEVATEIMSRGICFEEWLEEQKAK